MQSLDSCAAYSYTPKGSGTLGPVAQALAVGTNLDYLLSGHAVAESDDFGFASDAYATAIDLGTTTN